MGRTLFAAIAALMALAVVAPGALAAKRTVPVGFQGVDYDREIAWAAPGVQEEAWRTMARSGVESARVIFDWSEAQKTPGLPPSFQRTDPLVANAAARGIELLPVLVLAPEWARVLPGEKHSAPARPADFANYLRALVARYGHQGTFWAERPDLPRRPIRAWQVWNEPDMSYQWVPREDWPRAYGALLRAAHDALREVDPGARVVLAALTNFSWRSLRTLYDEGKIGGAFDVAGLNVYTREPDNLVEIVRRGRKVMSAHGDAKLPIRVTEFGASASAGRLKVGGDQDHLQTTDRKLAKLVLRAYDLLAANRKKLRIDRAYWYTWASSYDARDGGIFDFSGLVSFTDGAGNFASREALRAYRKSARRLQGCAKDANGACVTGG
jgi:hypothetical protein